LSTTHSLIQSNANTLLGIAEILPMLASSTNQSINQTVIDLFYKIE